MTIMTKSLKAFTLSATFIAASSASALELRGWNVHVEDYPVSIAMESFAAEVAERTGGDLTMKTFHNGVLGSQPDAIEQIRLGVLDFGEFSLGPMGTSIPETNVVSLPFIFPSIPAMYEMMDGEVGDAIVAASESSDGFPLIVVIVFLVVDIAAFAVSIKAATTSTT